MEYFGYIIRNLGVFWIHNHSPTNSVHISTLQIFPKHVIEFISLGGGAAAGPGGGGGVAAASSSTEEAAQKLIASPSLCADAQAVNRLARSHQDVSIMFMDIVGEQGGGGWITHVWGRTQWVAREVPQKCVHDVWGHDVGEQGGWITHVWARWGHC